MTAKLGSWWQKIRKPLAVIAVIVLVAYVLVLFILTGYRLTWTGFLAKTLWDWLQLLFVPIMLAIGGFWLNQIQKSREEKATAQRTEIERMAAEKRAETERDIAEDNQREVALQTYIDKMSELLLEKKLRVSAEDDEVRKIARIRTLTVLLHLNGVRKRRVLQFLYESGLVEKEKPIISLDGADLRKAALREANLNKTNLFGTLMSEALVDVEATPMSKILLRLDRFSEDIFPQLKVYPDQDDLSRDDLGEVALSRDNLGEVALSGANLEKADISAANLGGADLSRANLVEADLRKAYLVEADLRKAYLIGADLYGANLSGADLRGAILFGANLSRSNLRDAKVTTEQLNAVESLVGAIMPDGSKHP